MKILKNDFKDISVSRSNLLLNSITLKKSFKFKYRKQYFDIRFITQTSKYDLPI